MDIENHRYWVAFDRPGLGKHAILDTEIRVSGASWSGACDGGGSGGPLTALGWGSMPSWTPRSG